MEGIKDKIAQQNARKLIEVRLHTVGQNWIITVNELTCEILLLGSCCDGLKGYKASFSPAKLKRS